MLEFIEYMRISAKEHRLYHYVCRDNTVVLDYIRTFKRDERTGKFKMNRSRTSIVHNNTLAPN